MYLQDKKNTDSTWYARNVSDAKMPKLDNEKFVPETKTIDGNKVEFKRNGKWGNGYYFKHGDQNLYINGNNGFPDVKDLVIQVKEKKAKAEKDPNAPKATRKKKVDKAETEAKSIFNETDGGRAESSRPKQKQDAAVRAIAVATGKTYDEAFDVAKDLGRKADKSFDLASLLTSDAVAVPGFNALEVAPDEETLEEFVKANPTGTYIVATQKSLGVVKGGQYHDEAFEGSTKFEYVFRLDQIENASSPEPTQVGTTETVETPETSKEAETTKTEVVETEIVLDEAASA